MSGLWNMLWPIFLWAVAIAFVVVCVLRVANWLRERDYVKNRYVALLVGVCAILLFLGLTYLLALASTQQQEGATITSVLHNLASLAVYGFWIFVGVTIQDGLAVAGRLGA